MKPACPICGSRTFVDFRQRKAARCATCGSLERTRAIKLFLDRHVVLEPGCRVLHIAPEIEIGKFLHRRCGDGYEPADFDPGRYSRRLGLAVRKFDLCRDAAGLPAEHYDLILHSHVLEHIPCNYTVALQRLHRAVKIGGTHLFCVPVAAGYFAEDLDPRLGAAERIVRFGQADHMRRFGRDDFAVTLGEVFAIDAGYSLRDFFTKEDLEGARISEKNWSCSSATPFLVRKAAWHD